MMLDVHMHGGAYFLWDFFDLERKEDLCGPGGA